VTPVYVVVPGSVDDPAQPSGGNAYDRRICDGLAELGWSVHESAVPGRWPRPDTPAREALTAVLAGIPDGAVVLLDGLIASTVPDVLVPVAGRLRIVVLLHMPLGEAQPGDQPCAHDAVRAREAAALSAAVAVVTTSVWTRGQLLDWYGLAPGRVHVAEPGAAAAALVTGTASGGGLLCVAAVTATKGHDTLVAALAAVRDLPWQCVCVGNLDRDASFADTVRSQARDGGIDDRVRFTGPQTGAALNASYAAADVLVLASRAETYGMVVTEALARGLPVIATSVGGLPEALGRAADGSRPGLLVPPDDPAALAAALRDWLVDGDLRRQLRRTAAERRAALPGWSTTTAEVSSVLAEVAA
jgi:glycosyltransferase involved in cell wall biosynthesis